VLTRAHARLIGSTGGRRLTEGRIPVVVLEKEPTASVSSAPPK